MKLLLTGFDAFEGEKVNSSEEVVKRFRGKKIKNIQVNTKVLPTVFSKAPKELIAEIEKERPDFVICLGQVGGRAHISLERTATNLIDDSLKDNEGISIQGKKLLRMARTHISRHCPLTA